MNVVDEEAFTATSLGFPPYKRSHLPSKTYQAFVRIFPLPDQQSLQISPSPPLKSGQNGQGKEETFFSNKNWLVENEAEDRVENEQPIDGSMSAPAGNRIVGHVGVEESLLEESVGGQLFDGKLPVTNGDERNVVEDGEGGGLHEEKDVVDSADVEEGEIFEGMVETNLSDDQVVDDCIEVDDRNHEEQHIQKDKQVEQEGRHLNGLSLVGKGNSRDNLSPKQVKENKSVLGCRKTCKVKGIDVFDLMRDTILSKNDVHKIRESSKPDSLKHSGAISESVDIKNEWKAAPAKVLEASVQKKRVATKEGKSNKKAKKRKKRAEEDKKSGVKRLKLQPIAKPKEVVHCKYYINGKCQQGDECKFSHDITPLTKSKPCNFFALHQCLKGKDCPYDHDLFKYPCNNFKSKGFCSRGDACLFSHKIPLANDSPASDCNKIAADSGKQTAKGSNSQQALNILANMTPRTPSSLETTNRFPGKSVVEMKTPAQAPKGISFLSFGKASSGSPSKQPKCDLPGIGDNGVAVGSKSQGTSEKFNNSNEKSGKMLVTTQSLSQPPKRTAAGQNKSISNSAPREQSPTSQFASKWGNPAANTMHKISTTAGPVSGGQNKNIFNSALREPSLTSQFASKWGNLVVKQVQEAPVTAGPVAGGQNKNIYNSVPREPASTSKFASKWGNLVANKVHEAPTTAGPVAGGQNKNIFNSFPREPSSTSQFASKRGNLVANTVHEAPTTAVPVAGGQNKNIFNSAPREQSSTSQFASKWANPVANLVHRAPATAVPVAALKFDSKVTGRSVQSTAPYIPTVSSILQEFLFNSQ